MTVLQYKVVQGNVYQQAPVVLLSRQLIGSTSFQQVLHKVSKQIFMQAMTIQIPRGAI